MINKQFVSGLILAGGQSSRMDYQAKALMKLNGEVLIERIISQLNPQVDELIISANKDIELYSQYDAIVTKDILEGYQGPLSGIYAALEVMSFDYLVVVPCDSPDIPKDYVNIMLSAIQKDRSQVALAFDGSFKQPTFCIIHNSLKKNLIQYLQSGRRKLGEWLKLNKAIRVLFNDEKLFFNINTENDIKKYQLQSLEKSNESK